MRTSTDLFDSNQAADNEVTSESKMDLAYSGEVLLGAWSESSRRGRTVTLKLDEDATVHPMKQYKENDRFAMVLIKIEDDESMGEGKSSKRLATKPYGKYVQELHKNHWFANRKNIESAGTPQEYHQWVSEHGCALCDEKDEKKVSIVSFIADDPYASLSLCETHQHVTYAATSAIVFRNLKEWMSSAIAGQMGYESLGFVPPADFVQWCEQKGLRFTIPRTYLAALKKA